MLDMPGVRRPPGRYLSLYARCRSRRLGGRAGRAFAELDRRFWLSFAPDGYLAARPPARR
jgi:hypothetical protein